MKQGRMSIQVLITFVILAVVALLLISIAKGGIGNFFDFYTGQLDDLSVDPDQDGIVGMKDNCPCTPGVTEESIQDEGGLLGCPAGFTEISAQAERRQYDQTKTC